MSEQNSSPVHLRRDVFALPPGLAKLRSDLPVARMGLPNGATAWLVTRHDLISEVLSDPVRFGSDGRFVTDPTGTGTVAVSPDAVTVRHGDLTTYDPPEHGRLRRMISAGFSAKQVKLLQPRIESIVAEALDGMEAVGAPADLVQSFALVIPSMVICELLGVPYQDRREFQERAVVRLDSAGTPSARSRAVEDSVNYMKALVRQQRKEPGRGLIGLLIREHGDEIDDHELAGIGDLLLLGGHETTANMLALGTVLLLQHPEHQALVRDESTAGELIEELLRYLSVVQTGVPRVARVDTALGGRQIRQGERVLCSLPSGNHDESLTPDGDTFNPRRGRTHHLAFGHGIHYCVGAPLARLEMLKAFPALLERFPALHVTVPLEKIPFRPASAIYGAVSIPVSW